MKAFESVLAEDPWSVRADRVCLDRGEEFLSTEGEPAEQLREQAAITKAALEEMRVIGRSVPLESTLSYQSMLIEKKEVLRLLERKATYFKPGEPNAELEGTLQSAFDYGYAPKAEELGLTVCGQGTGMQ